MARIKVGGKFRFNSLSNEDKDRIIKNLAKKNKLPEIEEGVIPGMKIDGQKVTRDLVNKLEKKPQSKPKDVKEPKESEEVDIEKLNKEELEEFVLDRFGIDIDRRKSKKSLLKKVKKLMEEK